MKDKSRQNGQHTSEEDLSEFGVVRVISKPGPDAEDRLRRLFTLLLQYAAGGEAGRAGEGCHARRPARRRPPGGGDLMRSESSPTDDRPGRSVQPASAAIPG